MSDDVSTTPLSSQEMARTVALSATIAGAVLMIYFVDQLGHARFDPLFGWLRVMMESDPRYTAAHRYEMLGLVGVWGVSWILAGFDSIRSSGSRRLAIVAVGILIFGVIVVLRMNFMVRNFTLRGIGVSP